MTITKREIEEQLDEINDQEVHLLCKCGNEAKYVNNKLKEVWCYDCACKWVLKVKQVEKLK
jgi:hypothetical protein